VVRQYSDSPANHAANQTKCRPSDDVDDSIAHSAETRNDGWPRTGGQMVSHGRRSHRHCPRAQRKPAQAPRATEVPRRVTFASMRGRRDRHLGREMDHYGKPWRCQAATVSGLTITSAVRQAGHDVDSHAHSQRSAFPRRNVVGVTDHPQQEVIAKRAYPSLLASSTAPTSTHFSVGTAVRGNDRKERTQELPEG
jgi:hypothetical protein